MPRRTAIPAVKGYEDIFAPTAPSAPITGQIAEIPLEQLFPPEFHPFQVRDDALMRETAASVEKYGVLNPGIARPRAEGGYELVSGNRRRYACELVGLPTMPVIVWDLSNEAAAIIMVDSNLQREELLPSERAWAFRVKLEALNHRGRRSQYDEIPIGKLSVDVLSEEYKGQRGFSKSNIYRFVRLTELVPALLDMVDAGKLAVDPASLLSYLTRVEQTRLLDAMAKYETIPSPSQAKRLKELSETGTLSPETMEEIMAEVKKTEIKVTLTGRKLAAYFPREYTPRQMEAVIVELLEGWRSGRDEIKAAV